MQDINVDKRRVRLLQEGKSGKGPVVYWMSRDQRINDNWALFYAIELADELNTGVMINFALAPKFLEATLRQYKFMISGLKEMKQRCEDLNIYFHIHSGEPASTVSWVAEQVDAAAIVSDFDPLKIKRIWKRDVAKQIKVPFYEVDAHNIVPALFVTNKEEFGAYTIRPKIQKLLPGFLSPFPKINPIKKSVKHNFTSLDWMSVYEDVDIDFDVSSFTPFKAGEISANEMLSQFISSKLISYDTDRNNPNLNGQSNLSPYLHFGHISAQRVALEVNAAKIDHGLKVSFLEELIVRRELADNFCYFNTKYDSFDGFKDWAKFSLNAHRDDKREFTYTLEQFENAQTHEDLWNAAQLELLHKGKMHGYMRMYWAKKILEWTNSPDEAIAIAIYLNDKYEFDGRDPNGYAGIAWSIGGVHDRAWAERPVFGKIRYMNYNGCKRKFDTEAYIAENSKRPV